MGLVSRFSAELSCRYKVLVVLPLHPPKCTHAYPYLIMQGPLSYVNSPFFFAQENIVIFFLDVNVFVIKKIYCWVDLCGLHSFGSNHLLDIWIF